MIKEIVVGIIIAFLTYPINKFCEWIGNSAGIEIFSRKDVSYFTVILVVIGVYLIARFLPRKENNGLFYTRYTRKEKKFLKNFPKRHDLGDGLYADIEIDFNRLDSNRLFLPKLDFTYNCKKLGKEIYLGNGYSSPFCQVCNDSCNLHNGLNIGAVEQEILSRANKQWNDM